MIEKISYGPQEEAEFVQRMKDVSTGLKNILQKIEWTDERMSAMSAEEQSYLIKVTGRQLPDSKG